MKTGAIVIAEWLHEKTSRTILLDDAASLAKDIDAAIAASVAEERASSAETAMLAHQWMKRHDALLSWIQDNPSRLTDFVASGPRPPSPSPIDLPNAIAAAIAEEQARCAEIAQAKADEAHDSHTSNTVYDRAWRQSALKIKTAIERGE